MQSQKIVDRLKTVLKIKTDKELADRLMVNYNTLKTQLSRDSLDLGKIIEFAKSEGIELDYLFHNENITVSTSGNDATLINLSQGKKMNTLEQLLYQKYNKLVLDKKELAKELGISEMSINRRIMENDLSALPEFKRFGGNGRYIFPISAVAKFLQIDGGEK